MQTIDNTIILLSEAWTARDAIALAALWDPLEPQPLYMAEEVDQPLTSLAAIRDYWSRTLSAVGFIRMEVRNVQVRALAADLGSASYDMRWSGSFAGFDRPIGGATRVSAILRLRPEGWRFIQYVEAPLAPIVYMRHLYGMAAQHLQDLP